MLYAATPFYTRVVSIFLAGIFCAVIAFHGLARDVTPKPEIGPSDHPARLQMYFRSQRALLPQ